MLHLMESAHRRGTRRSGWMMGSTLVHGALIATVATTGTREIVDRFSEPVDRIIYTAPAPAAAAPAAAPQPAGAANRAAPPAPLPIDLKNIPLPGVGSIGDVTPTAAAPSDWGGGISLLPGAPTGGTAPGGVFDVRTVDRAVLPSATNRPPEYPPVLRSAGVTGDVLVRFVVDTSGRVEPSSVEIAHASHDLFADAVRRWLPRTRYVPAEVAGRRVRQLVEQRVDFALQR